MAVSVTAINAITKQLFIPKLADNVIVSNSLLMFLEKNNGLASIGGGQDQHEGPMKEQSFVA